MVKKMKLKLWLCLVLSAFIARPALAANPGLHYINTRGNIRCGTETGNKILAYKDENGKWQGINVELCKMLSTAVFGRSDRIAMVPLASNQVSKALRTNKIDVMIGGLPFSATTEMSTRAAPVDVWYYDRQVFLAHAVKNATRWKLTKAKKYAWSTMPTIWPNSRFITTNINWIWLCSLFPPSAAPKRLFA